MIQLYMLLTSTRLSDSGRRSCLACIYIIAFLLLTPFISVSQKPASAALKAVAGKADDLFGSRYRFVENIGQYGSVMQGYESMGTILYGYEGLGMPVLFTNKGLIHLQRKEEKISHEEEERLEKQGVSEEEIENKKIVTDRVITMEWAGANSNPEMIAEGQTSMYNTYATLQGKARGYKKITWKNLYPGIDAVYHFTEQSKAGFEYSLVVHPGADLNQVKLVFGGQLKKIQADAKGNLVIQSDIGGISETVPVTYYGENPLNKAAGEVETKFSIQDKTIRFSFPNGYDAARTMVIDPFVTATGNLTGLNAGKAKDVDFDYNGNVYVTGGGTGTFHQLAKFDAAGNLLWTFSGSLTLPSWTFGTYWGGWMVEKPTGNIYLGQGFNPTTGFQVIRVSTTGLYDNYITNANPNFREAWKMLWSCNNGSPEILVAGGGTNSNINFGVFTPPSAAIGSLNVTGIAYTGGAGWAQDIVDFIIDPSNNDMYTIYGSLFGNPSLTNKMYKNTAPYSGASVAWNVPSGFTSVQEIANRPYLAGGQIDNSANIFAINANYLFYWDGKNLKAFNKATGAGVGTPLVTANVTLMQGGIVADACDNVFVGDGNGVIKVYKFNGSVFDDAAAADISIPGFNGRAVYDLAYDESRKLIYASGDGFVGSFDISAYCPATQYTLLVTPNCLTGSATVTVTPAPPAGSTVNYVLYNGTTQLASNTTGVFNGLLPTVTYTVTATINLLCSGTQATVSFVMPGPTIITTSVNATCGNSTGSITATGGGSASPFTYSIDGITFQASGTFSGLAAGVYTVTVKDANGCKTTTTVVISNTNGPAITYTSTNANCGINNGSVTVNATGGTTPYQYNINGGSYQSGNFFTGLVGGTYTVTVKDASGCTNAVIVTITSSTSPQLTAIPASATCGLNNGTITAFGTGGTAPLTYSINGNVFQAGNIFNNVSPGSYTVTVKDANGCTATVSVTVANSPAPTVTAVGTSATCANQNGIITATGAGGQTPYQYSINGVTFQIGNVFAGLAPGVYTVTVKDNSGCTNTVSVTVAGTTGPTVTAVSTVSACNVNSGSITISASGGTPAYTYSINGITFQASNLFTGLGGGNYVAYVRDAGGCIGTFPITVGFPAGPSLSVTITPTACAGNTGVITATGSGAAPPFQYSLDGVTYGASNIFSGLATGSYTVYVKDGNGCIKTVVATITNVSGLTLSASALASSCSANSGTITATATGGVAPLQYSINGVTYQASNVFNGNAPGVYTVYVKDANNCIVTATVTVTSASGLVMTATALLQGTCGSASGVIRVIASGGVAPLTYNIDGGAYQPVNIFINVAAGVHTVTVKDASNCTLSATVTITNSGVGTPPTNVTFNVKDALACTGATGRIKNLKGVPSGGGATYIFSLDGGPFTTANQFTNVPPGVHTVTAQNEEGCNVTRLVTIGSGTPATATAAVTASACGSSTGTIVLTGVGVNTPYHASIDNGATWITFNTTTTFAGLAPGTYNIIIADDADFVAGPPDIPGACLTTIFVSVPSTGGPSISTTTTNPTCTALNGSITATGGGGVPPYTYNINGGAYFVSGVFNNLGAGIYAVNVKDATGCTTGANVLLSNPAVPVVTAALQSAACNTNNGSITASVSGGVAPFQYSINGTTFQASNVFSGLAPGSYTLYVTDANNCFGTTSVVITNTALPKATAFTIAASCGINDGTIFVTGTLGTAPYTFSLDGLLYQSGTTFSNLAAGFYTIYIKDARGCITTTGVSVPNGTAPVISATATVAAKCDTPTGSITVTASGGTGALQYSVDGVTFQASNVFTGLLPGNYVVTVKDANGCIATKLVVVANTAGPQVLTAVIVDAACGLSNGSITASASGGVAPLQYSINGVTYQAGTLFSAVAAGPYTLFVKDVNGCIKSIPVTVLNLPAPALTLSASPASCGGLSDGTITATATGGTGALTYSLNAVTFQASNVFTGLPAGSYTVTVKDARGCTTQAPVTITSTGTLTVPLFVQVAPVCSGAVLAALPTTSTNGVTGTWSPALNNTTTTLYTFTPTAGLCAATATMTITVNPKPGPIIISHN